MTAPNRTAVRAVESVPRNFSTRLDYDSSGNLLYLGISHEGAGESEPFWAIRKFPLNIQGLLGSILWAGGESSQTEVWDDRASLTYS